MQIGWIVLHITEHATLSVLFDDGMSTNNIGLKDVYPLNLSMKRQNNM